MLIDPIALKAAPIITGIRAGIERIDVIADAADSVRGPGVRFTGSSISHELGQTVKELRPTITSLQKWALRGHGAAGSLKQLPLQSQLESVTHGAYLVTIDATNPESMASLLRSGKPYKEIRGAFSQSTRALGDRADDLAIAVAKRTLGDGHGLTRVELVEEGMRQIATATRNATIAKVGAGAAIVGAALVGGYLIHRHLTADGG